MPWRICVDSHYRCITLTPVQDSFQGWKLSFHTSFDTSGRVISPGFCHAVRGATLPSCQTPGGEGNGAGEKVCLCKRNYANCKILTCDPPPRWCRWVTAQIRYCRLCWTAARGKKSPPVTLLLFAYILLHVALFLLIHSNLHHICSCPQLKKKAILFLYLPTNRNGSSI